MFRLVLRGIFIFAVIMLVSALVIDKANNRAIEKPINKLIDNVIYGAKPYPKDRIKEEQIKIYPDKVVIEVKNAKYASFADTHSEEPLFGSGSNAIQITPSKPEDIQLGDIISYKSSLTNEIIIHRVINIDKDEKGLYYTVKGDNNDKPDQEKIRFEQVKSLLIGVIY